VACFEQINLQDMSELLRADKGWAQITIPRTNEICFGCIIPNLPSARVVVYTSIDPATGLGRRVGGDAIRVNVLSTVNNRPLIEKQRRVHRVKNWRTNLQARIADVWAEMQDRARKDFEARKQQQRPAPTPARDPRLQPPGTPEDFARHGNRKSGNAHREVREVAPRVEHRDPGRTFPMPDGRMVQFTPGDTVKVIGEAPGKGSTATVERTGPNLVYSRLTSGTGQGYAHNYRPDDLQKIGDTATGLPVAPADLYKLDYPVFPDAEDRALWFGLQVLTDEEFAVGFLQFVVGHIAVEPHAVNFLTSVAGQSKHNRLSARQLEVLRKPEMLPWYVPAVTDALASAGKALTKPEADRRADLRANVAEQQTIAEMYRVMD
jgi:hypothetical protein